MPRRFLGTVHGKSTDVKSLRDKIINEAKDKLDRLEEEEEEEEVSRQNDQSDGNSREGLPVMAESVYTEEGKVKRNHKIYINYFRCLDDIISDSYEKQKASYEIVRAVTQLFESRGQDVPFDEVRFERAAKNLAMCQMMREMSWLFGLSPAHTDRIVDHTIDRLFGNPKVSLPPTSKNENSNPYKRKE